MGLKMRVNPYPSNNSGSIVTIKFTADSTQSYTATGRVGTMFKTFTASASATESSRTSAKRAKQKADAKALEKAKSKARSQAYAWEQKKKKKNAHRHRHNHKPSVTVRVHRPVGYHPFHRPIIVPAGFHPVVHRGFVGGGMGRVVALPFPPPHF